MNQKNDDLKEIHLLDYQFLFSIAATCLASIACGWGINRWKNHYKEDIEKYAEYSDSYSKSFDIDSKIDSEKIEIKTLYDTAEKEEESAKTDEESPEHQTKTSKNESENQKHETKSPENKTESPEHGIETQKSDNETPKNEINSQENKKVADEIENRSQRKKLKEYAKEEKRVNKLIEKLDFTLDVCEIELNGIIYKTHKKDIDEFMKDISCNKIEKNNEIDLINARAKCFQRTIEKYNIMVNDCIKETMEKYKITDSNFWKISRVDQIERKISKVKEEQKALHLENYSISLIKKIEEEKNVEIELENFHSTDTTDDYKIIYYDSNHLNKNYENFEQTTTIEHFQNTYNTLREKNKQLKEIINLNKKEFDDTLDNLYEESIELKRIRTGKAQSCYLYSKILQYYQSIERNIINAKKL